MVFRAIVAAAAAWLACASGAQAQTPPESHLVLAREIVELSGTRDSMDAIVDTMAPMFEADVRSRGLSAEDAATMTRYFMEEVRIAQPRILELSAIAYAGAFTEEQLMEIRDFFRTETGQALRARTPGLSSAMGRAGRLMGEEAGRRAAQRFLDERERGGGGPS